MKIRFNDSGETYDIIGEKNQFWLFNFPDGRLGKAVKGNSSYKLIEPWEAIEQHHFGMEVPDEEITVRDELSTFSEESSDETA